MLRQSISLVLIASQVLLGTMVASADMTTPAAPSPEFTLLQNVLALQGQSLSAQTRDMRISGILDQYTSNAPKDGRGQRLETALVQLGVYTQAQAATFMNASQAADETVRATQLTSTSETREVLAKQVARLAQLHPMGAQFSTCDVGYIAGLAGVATAIAGLVLRYDNPSCYDQYQGSSFGCYYDEFGNYFCDNTDYYTTQCTQADYYPHRSLGNGLLIGGGIAAAVGAVIVLTQPECS